MNVESKSEAEVLEVSASKEPGIKLDSRSSLELFRSQLPTLNVPSSYINSDPKGRFHCYKIYKELDVALILAVFVVL